MLTLTPPRPNLWYYRDDCLKMALEPGEAEISPMGHDTVIVKEIGGQRFDALHLPTSNEGRPTWVIPEQYLEPLLVK